MIHKGLMIFGSVVAIAPSLGSAGYFIVPPLLKTLPRHISQVKNGSECFVALTGKDKLEAQISINLKDSYLLVCRTNANDLNFFYYVADDQRVAIPVKVINVAKENNERDITIKFFWKASSTLQTQQPLESIQWISKDGQDYELKHFCNKTNIRSFNSFGSTQTKALMCYRGKGEAEEEQKQETWKEFTNWGV